MGLLDIFKRDSAGATPASAAADTMSGEQAQQARVRARRRLIGAVVLLGIGVIAFPLLFETQPRPIPVDIPIVIPPREGAPPLALPAARPTAKAVLNPAASAPTAVEASASAPAPGVVQSAPPQASSAAVAKAAEPAVAKPAAAKPNNDKSASDKPVADKPSPAATKAAVDTAKPASDAAKTAAVSAQGRFVVQIGAFAEAAAVSDARNKARKAGLATFTEVVETSSGRRTRVRVGPFASREDAEKAAAQVKAAGLPGSVRAL